MKRLAIVPARGGSKRIPNKNIREFCGKPMIAHILGAAQASGLFAAVHVSTEDDAIAKVAAACGFPPEFRRPADLSDDFTPLMPVLRHAASEYAARDLHFDEIWLLMACAPLVEAQDLVAAAEMFRRSEGKRALLAVCEFPAPVQRAFGIDADGTMSMVQPEMFPIRSQDLAKRYYDAGSFAIFPPARVLQAEGAGSATDFLGHVLPKGTAVDIDDEHDWQLAEAIYRVKKNRG